MKKILCLLTMVLILTGCSTTPKEEKENVKNKEQQEQQITMYFGKVASATGNEISIDVAKNPFIDEDAKAEGDSGDGEVIAAVEMTAAMPASESTGAMQEEENKIELEYTGEEKSLTLPAGVKIIDAKSGEEVPMSEIKEGTVLSVTFDEISQSIIEIQLLEK